MLKPWKLRASFVSLFAVACGGAAFGQQAPAADKPIRALLVLGGCCHDYEHQKDILKKGISERANVEVTIAYDPDQSTSHKNPVYADPDWSKNFDVVIHDECSADVKDVAFIEKVLKPHQGGLPAVLLHCGMHSYRSEGYPKHTPWFEFTGMNTNHHGPQLPIDIVFADKDNPITKGMADWTTIREELYHTESLAATAKPLATGEQKGEKYKDKNPVVWTNDYHGARVFATTLGHNNETVSDRRYLDLVTRGLLWSVNKLDDQHLKAPKKAEGGQPNAAKATDETIRKIASSLKAPAGMDLTVFAAPPDVGYPTSVSASPTGEVFVAIDENGSLDRNTGRGRVVRCVDTDGDGRADRFNVFATMDHPRGVIWDAGTLYVLQPPFLTAYHDDDGDGAADRSDVLVSGVTVERTQNARGADHTTNGIRLGIDGWIYIAMGDFGCLNAVGKDGATLQKHGGGIVRVRADGAGLEEYTRGQRNIYDVAIDPLMNAFTRDNTNDGDGWNDRLSYIVPTGFYGYPTHFKRFADEIVQPLADYGGGSPCGSLFLQEPGLPAELNNMLLTVEWGNSVIDRHPLTPDGAGFKAGHEKVMDLPRGTDIDVDGQGRLYAASWANGGFNYSGPDVGYVVRLSAKDAKAETFPDLKKADERQLVDHLASPSAVRRQAAQRELLRRGAKAEAVAPELEKLARSDKPLASRVAAVFTLQLVLKEKSHATLVDLAKTPELREFALRALADRKQDASVSAEPFVKSLRDTNPRVRLAAAWGLGRLGRTESATTLVPLLGDADPLVAHVAANSLTALKGVDACLAAIDSSSPDVIPGALRVLQSLHETQVVEGLLAKLTKTDDAALRSAIYGALARLYFREANWDGAWWGTRPDTSGPYYGRAEWEGTPTLRQAFQAALAQEKPEAARSLVAALQKNKVDFPELTQYIIKGAESDPALRPALVQAFADRHDLTPEQLALILPLAKSDKESPETREKAVRLIARNASTPAAVDAAIELLTAGVKPDENFEPSDATMEFARDPRRGDDVKRFAQLAGSDSAAKRDLAYLVLVNLARPEKAKENVRSAAAAAIEKGWEKPQSAITLLRIVGRTKAKGYNDWVEAMLEDPSPDVMRAAGFAAERLGMKHKGPSADTRELIEKLGFDKSLALAKETKGDPVLGKELFTKQGCVTCHTVSPSEPPKGPMLAGIAGRYNREELCESILKPSAKIAQGFETQWFKMKDGSVQEGFVSREGGDDLELHNVTGQAILIEKNKIQRRGKRDISVMPEGLVAALTPQDLASIVAYLESLKAN